MSYAQRAINLTLMKGKGPYGEDGYEAPITVSGLRMTAMIEVAGMPQANRMTLRAYGMRQSEMNEFSRAGVNPYALRRNLVYVEAGDADAQSLSLVYGGILYQSYQDFQAAPEVSFNVDCSVALFNQIKPASPTSYTGSTDVATIMSKLAGAMGYDFEANGVNKKIQSPYLWGTLRQQVEQCAYAANIYAFIENEKTLVILDKLSARQGYITPIDANSGMVGYPVVMQPGHYSVRTLFNPNILMLGKVKITSSIKSLCGTFRVRGITHTLESQMPGGAWFTDVHYSWFGTI